MLFRRLKTHCECNEYKCNKNEPANPPASHLAPVKKRGKTSFAHTENCWLRYTHCTLLSPCKLQGTNHSKVAIQTLKQMSFRFVFADNENLKHYFMEVLIAMYRVRSHREDPKVQIVYSLKPNIAECDWPTQKYLHGTYRLLHVSFTIHVNWGIDLWRFLPWE